MNANPYQPPVANLLTESAASGTELAGRGARFAAAFLDSVLALVYAVPLMFLLGTMDYIRRGQQPPFPLLLAGAALGFAGFVALHGYFLKANGQTLGKKLIGIRIVGLDGQVPPLARLIGLRYLPIQLAVLVPILGNFAGLVDVLFVFRDDRRCVHDLICGTRVVKV